MREQNRQSGFTLIELMVVVLIIGLVSSIAVPMLNRALQKANRTATGAQLLQLHDAMARYYADNGEFPTLDPMTFEPLVSDGYIDSADALLSKFDGGKPWIYLDLGEQGWWYVVYPKGDNASRIYAGQINIPGGLGIPINYDGVYWYNPKETPHGLARLDGQSIWG